MSLRAHCVLLLSFCFAAPAFADGPQIAFSGRLDYAVGSGPRDVVVARINDDRFSDVVVATDAGLAVLFGTPSGHLSAPLAVPVRGSAQALAMIDTDDDGVLDAVTADKLERSLRLHSGDGAGGFSARAPRSIQRRPVDLVAGPFASNGSRSLVAATDAGLWFGDDSTDPAADYVVASDTPFSRVIRGDFDGNGQIDIGALRQDRGEIRTFTRSPDRRFAPWQTTQLRVRAEDAASGNLDAKRGTDVALIDRHGAAVLLSDGQGGFETPKRIYRSTGARAIAVADFDGDGVDDVTVADEDRRAVVLLQGLGGGNFRPYGGYSIGAATNALATGDIDGDGRIDLIAANRRSGTVTLLRNLGGGLLDGALVFDAGSDPVAAVAVDVNADGNQDLVVIDHEPGIVHTLLGSGGARFRLGTSIPVGSRTSAVIVAHLDGDDWIDIAVTNQGDDNVALLAGTGPGSFASPQFLAVGRAPTALVAVDANGDHHLDIAVVNSGSDSVTVLLGDRRGLYRNSLNYPVMPKPEFLVRGDLNGDGNRDLLVGRSADRTVVALLRSGSGYRPQPPERRARPVQPSPSRDLDGDGLTDLVVPAATHDAVDILMGNDQGGFEGPRRLAAGRRPVAVAIGEFNRDGRPDLAVVNRGSRTILLLLNESDQAERQRDTDKGRRRPKAPNRTSDPFRRPGVADRNPAWQKW